MVEWSFPWVGSRKWSGCCLTVRIQGHASSDSGVLIETEKTDKDLVKTLEWMKKEIKRTDGSFEWDRSTIEETQVHWIGPNRNTMRRRPFS